MTAPTRSLAFPAFALSRPPKPSEMVNKSVFPPRGYPNHSFVLGLFCVLALLLDACAAHAQSTGLRVGAAVAELLAEDTMEIGGSILPGKVTGQEGKLRAVAVVLEKRPYPKVAIVACDVLMLTRDLLDPVVAEIEKTSGIPAAGVLINCTHTHHAPSTVRVHGYGRDEKFCAEVQRKTIEVFRKMRRERMAQQGQERTTWLQAMVIGDVAIWECRRSSSRSSGSILKIGHRFGTRTWRNWRMIGSDMCRTGMLSSSAGIRCGRDSTAIANRGPESGSWRKWWEC